MAKIVYSSGPVDGEPKGPTDCPVCRGTPCGCEPSRSLAPLEQRVRVRRDRSGRKGKTVTVTGPFRLTRSDVMALLRALKVRCGSGGTLKAAADRQGNPAFVLELQGDHVERVMLDLTQRGYDVKRSGG